MMNIMKNSYLFLATAIIALASCSENTYLGPEGTEGGAGTISFEMSTPTLTRAREGADAASDLKYKFAVYATKTVGSTTSNVFAQNTYTETEEDANSDNKKDGASPYWVWYLAGTQNTTQSNTSNWEYVGSGGTSGAYFGTAENQVHLEANVNQTIKYWDYAADNYVFTAYSNTAGGTVSNITTTGFNFNGTPAQFAGLYVAEKLTITARSNPAAHTTADNKIGDAVKLSFSSSAAKVRLGIYETIPGYNVKNVNFKPTSPASFDETQINAQLSGSFNGGGTSASAADFTVTYDAGNKAQFATTATVSNNFVFGTFDTDGTPYLGETSISPTWANASSDYISVFPNTDHTGNMILYVDYELYNTKSGETINVKGAKAVVPAAYMTWKPNYAYTYLFKISDNTNGYTGEGTLPSGLWPITFDAVTVAATDASEGSITTVSTPSITTYQNGSVSDAGITYANAKGLIYITVNTDGTLATLNASGTTVKLYTVAEGTTEADLMLASNYAKTDVTTGGTDALTIQTSNTTVNSITFSANQFATFTPTANTTYAFEYSKDAVATTYKAATGTYVPGTKYYTDNTGATEVDTEEFTEGVPDVSSYFVVDVAGTPAVKAYKVIQIVAAS